MNDNLPSGYLEAPLVALVNIDMASMTEEELRAHVQKLQDARTSQSFYAEARRTVKQDAETKKMDGLLDEFD